jgi:hypothetical protein
MKSMNRRITYWGIALIVISILMPVIFYLLSLSGSDLIEGVFGGIDWFCCASTSGISLITGLFILLVGLRTE